MWTLSLTPLWFILWITRDPRSSVFSILLYTVHKLRWKLKGFYFSFVWWCVEETLKVHLKFAQECTARGLHPDHQITRADHLMPRADIQFMLQDAHRFPIQLYIHRTAEQAIRKKTQGPSQLRCSTHRDAWEEVAMAHQDQQIMIRKSAKELVVNCL